ncbi:MAG: hypothetical protein FJ386_11005 [Verrucomicrobia bacterium]|nr:hypothetical protein [Verrucomicrobiota bacterium]
MTRDPLCFVRSCLAVLVGAMLASCATVQPVDWAARMGTYTFDDAVKEYGAPDKGATLTDGARVSEWRVRKGHSSAYVTGYPTHPYLRVEVPPATDEWLRLTFGAEGKLKEFKRYWR